jgi:hypothetical protein
MNWLNRAEARLGHLAIPGLPQIIVGFNALVFILHKLNPHFVEKLTLDPSRIMQGEVWRLVTYLFIPSFGAPFADWLLVAFYLMFLWFVGTGLEEAMGAFKLNVYYLLGMIGVTIAAWISHEGGFSNGILNTAMFFAFARFYPEVVIYVMFILPVKVKWMAWFSAALLLLGFLAADWPYRLALIAALMNYSLFFGSDIIRDARHRGQVASRRKRFDREIQSVESEALHRCAVCGRTEQVAPDLEFRVARDGQEYCREHLPKPAPAS